MDSAATDPTVPELIDIWEEALRSVIAVCEPLTDAQWRAQSPCPGWSVADVVAHTVDIEQVLAGSPRPDHVPDWDAASHVTGDFNRFTEVGVDYRRSQPKDAVLAELADTMAVRRAQLDAVPEGVPVVGPLGNETSLERLLRVRTFDVWVHEQDIRAAVGADGDWDTKPALIAFQQMTRAVPVIWARDVKAPAGSVVSIRVTGPGITGEVHARVDEDGHGHAVEPVGDPDVALTASWPDFMALAAGRVDPSDDAVRARLEISGAPALSDALLDELAMTP